MKILLFSKNKDIELALKKLGHKVIIYDENRLLSLGQKDLDKLIEDANKSDFFLFETGGVMFENQLNFLFSLNGFVRVMSAIKCKKVFYYTDKIWGLGGPWMAQIIPNADYGFVNDDTWLRRQIISNVFPLHLGVSNKEPEKGEFKKELSGDMAFMGDIFGPIENFVSYLKKEYGRRLKVYEPVEGKELADLCASNKIIIFPRFPSDDFFWTDTIYKILCNGGFLVYPRLEGLKEEGFISGKHYISYGSRTELTDIIEHFTDSKNEEERLKIAVQGKKFVLDNFRYSQRFKKMFDTIKEEMIKKNG